MRQNVLGLIAIFIALCGSAVATQAVDQPGAKSAKAKKRGPRGPAGPQGLAGQQGPAGPQGAPGSLTGTAGGDLTGAYPNPDLAMNSVGPAELANSAVVGGLAGDVQDNTVNVDDLAPNSVAPAELANSAVVGGLGGDVQDNTVGVDDLAPDSVAASELATSAVVGGAGGDLLDNSVTSDDLAGAILLDSIRFTPQTDGPSCVAAADVGTVYFDVDDDRLAVCLNDAGAFTYFGISTTP